MKRSGNYFSFFFLAILIETILIFLAKIPLSIHLINNYFAGILIMVLYRYLIDWTQFNHKASKLLRSLIVRKHPANGLAFATFVGYFFGMMNHSNGFVTVNIYELIVLSTISAGIGLVIYDGIRYIVKELKKEVQTQYYTYKVSEKAGTLVRNLHFSNKKEVDKACQEKWVSLTG